MLGNHYGEKIGVVEIKAHLPKRFLRLEDRGSEGEFLAHYATSTVREVPHKVQRTRCW